MVENYERSPDDKITMCRTNAWGLHKCHVTWEIPGFTELLVKNDKMIIKTDDLNMVEEDGSVWNLVMAVDMKNLPEEEMLSNLVIGSKRVGLKLMLSKTGEGCSGYNVLYRMGLVTSEGHESHVKSPPEHTFKESEQWGFHGLVDVEDLLDELKGLTPKGKIATFCEMTITKWQENGPKEPVLMKDLRQDLEHLFTTGAHSDSTVLASDARLPAHRAILEARSDQFQFRGLGGDFTLDLSDFNKRTVWDFLLFLYTGKTENIDRTSGELMALASRYMVKELEDECVKALYKKLKAKNSTIILERADEIGRQDLNDEVLKYMVGCPLVKSLTDWEAFSKSNYVMALDTLIKVSQAATIKDD